MCQNVSCHCSNLFKRKLWGLCLVKSLEFLVRIIIAINHSFKLKYSIATQQSILFMPDWTWVRNKCNTDWTNGDVELCCIHIFVWRLLHNSYVVCLWNVNGVWDDKDCLSVCSHFSCLDDDQLIIRRGACQINLTARLATALWKLLLRPLPKSSPLWGMTQHLCGILNDGMTDILG